MTNLKASLVDKVRALASRTVADIVLRCQEEDRSEGDNSFVDLVRRIAIKEMISFRSMAKIENAARDAKMCGDNQAILHVFHGRDNLQLRFYMRTS